MKGNKLRQTSLAATLALTSHAEYAAGVAAGWPMYHPFGADSLAIGLPWLLPIAIDCYVVDALERRKGMDRWAALGILALSVIGGSAYTADHAIEAVKAGGVGVILVLVLARLYAPVRASKEDLAAEAAAKAERKADADRAARLRTEEVERAARLDAERARTLAEAEATRIAAESAAEVARIQAQAGVDAQRTVSRRSAKRPSDRPRTTAKASMDAPNKDAAARMVASAIRAHKGPEPYVFDWQKWSAEHGGGRSFWFGARQAAEQPVHLARTGATG